MGAAAQEDREYKKPRLNPFAVLCVCVYAQVLQRKRRRASLKKRSLENSKSQAAEYHKLLMSRLKEQRERRCAWKK